MPPRQPLDRPFLTFVLATTEISPAAFRFPPALGMTAGAFFTIMLTLALCFVPLQPILSPALSQQVHLNPSAMSESSSRSRYSPWQSVSWSAQKSSSKYTSFVPVACQYDLRKEGNDWPECHMQSSLSFSVTSKSSLQLRHFT